VEGLFFLLSRTAALSMRNNLNDSENLKEQFLPLTYLNDFNELLFGTQTIGQRSVVEKNQHQFIVDSPWSIIRQNHEAICKDETIFLNNTEFRVNPDNLQKKGKHNLIVHHSSRIEDCYFNTSEGPIIIDENAFIMGASAFRGPVYIGKHSVVKMSASIYGGTSIGPHCVIGGEVKNSIFQGYSNKGHHGYIGDSFIGTWSRNQLL
jgi:acetyltransferase-like isoleucine patch superfamily enzyme